MAKKDNVKLLLYGKPETGALEGAEKAVIEACLKVQSKARALAPVDSGRLRSSIAYKTRTSGDGELEVNPKMAQGFVGTNVNYATYVEFGTRRQIAQPFLRPAVGSLTIKDIDVIQSIQKAMIESAKKGVKKV